MEEKNESLESKKLKNLQKTRRIKQQLILTTVLHFKIDIYFDNEVQH